MNNTNENYGEDKRKFLSDFKSALQFITILPSGKNSHFSPSGMIRFFPIIGLVIGSLLIVFDLIASVFFYEGVVVLLDLIFLVVITGAFHLDGVGDTADGIFSHRSREKALLIMKDSRTGMMGLVAVVCTLAVKFAGIYSVKASCSGTTVMLLFLIIPAYARSSMIFGIKFLNYGREKGTGHDFFTRELEFKDFIWLCIPVIISVFTGYKFIIINFSFGLMVFAILFFYKKKMNCITGDMLGAMTEVIEALLFVVAGMTLF
ncbi:MAG: adenosylcobinamide-GDP ribazoletransferase [Desulfobacterales bacterium]|nr:adenosylcobinamide-GDP ribazoletransferase [Desulfobacterales bacterium]